MNHISNFIKAFFDANGVNRRLILYVTVYMSWKGFEWAAHFAGTSTKTGAEEAMIIAAVLMPISALQGFVFKVYTDSRPGGDKKEDEPK